MAAEIPTEAVVRQLRRIHSASTAVLNEARHFRNAGLLVVSAMTQFLRGTFPVELTSGGQEPGQRIVVLQAGNPAQVG
jgi:hypothetical protein